MNDRDLALKLRACGATITDEEMRDPARLRAVLNSVRASIRECALVLAQSARFGVGTESDDDSEVGDEDPHDNDEVPHDNDEVQLEFMSFEEFATQHAGLIDPANMMRSFIETTIYIMRWSPEELVTDEVLGYVATADGITFLASYRELFPYLERAIPIAIQRGVDMRNVSINAPMPIPLMMTLVNSGVPFRERNAEMIYNRYGLERLREVLDSIDGIDYDQFINEAVKYTNDTNKWKLLNEYASRGGRVNMDKFIYFFRRPRLSQQDKKVLPKLLKIAVSARYMHLTPSQARTEAGKMIAHHIEKIRHHERELERHFHGDGSAKNRYGYFGEHEEYPGILDIMKQYND